MSLKPPKKNKDGERIPISSAAILLKLSRDLNKATNSTTRRELKKQIKDVEKVRSFFGNYCYRFLGEIEGPRQD